MNTSPRYFRKKVSESGSSNTEEEYPRYVDSKLVADDPETLNVTGLREKKLLILIVWLIVLFILAVIICVINILLIVVLRMNRHGMQALKIYNYEDSKTGQEESIVHFAADKSHIDHVIVPSGKVYGPNSQNFMLQASRIILGQPVENTTKFLLQEGSCRFENVNDFLVLSPENGKPLFSAQHPLVSIDQKIKQLASRNIITNKIRAPVNEDLLMKAENILIRGNEGIQVEARSLNITTKTILALNTTADGSLYFSARKIFIGNQWRTLPMSSSPALSASIEAFRVCICKSTPSRAKFFIVNGNRPCIAPTSVCK
uniref:Beta-sarcoglycan n=1 Tax=Panagrolaimus sp. JU765 TaxID=591449 RepID=A0AC34Q6E7_9BILA